MQGLALFGLSLCLSLVGRAQQPPPPSSDTQQMETEMWDMVNHDRTASSQAEETKGRARALVWDPKLAAVARQHSEEMARTGIFSHTGGDGSLPSWRVSMAGVRWLSTAENIARVDNVIQAEALFMNEPKFERNHRWNILNPNFTHVGIGIARGPDGSLYITQEFVQTR